MNNGGCPKNESCINTVGGYYCDNGITTTPSVDALRLVGGPNEAEGRLEVYHSSVWGTVCDDAFGHVDAGVACRTLGLGFTNGITLGNQYGSGTGQIWLDDLQCTGQESSLFNCPHPGWGIQNCGHSEDVSIRCNNEPDTTKSPDVDSTSIINSVDTVRVVDGPNGGEGRLEVYHNAVWGTVCDDAFEDVDASVACQSLGLGYTGGTTLHNQYGPGAGEIWLDNVQCTGSEPSFFSCTNTGWGNHNCNHDEDVSITCHF